MNEPPMISFVDIAPPPGGEQRLRQALIADRRRLSSRGIPWAVAVAATVVVALGLGLSPWRDTRPLEIASAVAEAVRPVEELQLSAGSASRLPAITPGVTVYLLHPAAAGTD